MALLTWQTCFGRGLTIRGENQWGAAGHNKVHVCKQSINHIPDEGGFVLGVSQECISHTYGIYRNEPLNYSLKLHVHTLVRNVTGHR